MIPVQPVGFVRDRRASYRRGADWRDGGSLPALSGGGLKLQATSGHPDAGILSSDRFNLSGSFWNVATSHTSRRLYLPLVVR